MTAQISIGIEVVRMISLLKFKFVNKYDSFEYITQYFLIDSANNIKY
jgi:hypothetical protein